MRIAIKNLNDESKILIIEPWAEEFEIGKDDEIEIVIDENTFFDIEQHISGKYISLWCPINSKVCIFINGKKIDCPSLLIPCP
jgi:pseudouridine-5'-phosphate glycosidase